MQAGPSRLETFLLCFVVAFDEPHELTHAVPCRRQREEVATQGVWEASQLGCELFEIQKLSWAVSRVKVPKQGTTGEDIWDPTGNACKAVQVLFHS